jgi:hypothetical protein
MEQVYVAPPPPANFSIGTMLSVAIAPRHWLWRIFMFFLHKGGKEKNFTQRGGKKKHIFMFFETIFFYVFFVLSFNFFSKKSFGECFFVFFRKKALENVCQGHDVCLTRNPKT